MIVSLLFMSPYWRNIPPIGEWLCYVHTFYLLTNKEELDVYELDKNLVELKELCEMYSHPKTAFFELLYEKFKEHRNHPNLKELMLELIRTKVKFDGVHSETEQVGADNPETSTGDIDNPETTTCDTDSPETTTFSTDNAENSTGDTDNPETTTSDINITTSLLDAENAPNFHGNEKNAAENEQITDLKDGTRNEQSDEIPDREKSENAKAQNAVNDAENDNTTDASVSWINVAKDDTVEIHEDQTTDKSVGGGEEVTEVEKGNADKFEDDSEDEDGFVRVEYKDLEWKVYAITVIYPSDNRQSILFCWFYFALFLCGREIFFTCNVVYDMYAFVLFNTILMLYLLH